VRVSRRPISLYLGIVDEQPPCIPDGAPLAYSDSGLQAEVHIPLTNGPETEPKNGKCIDENGKKGWSYSTSGSWGNCVCWEWRGQLLC